MCSEGSTWITLIKLKGTKPVVGNFEDAIAAILRSMSMVEIDFYLNRIKFIVKFSVFDVSHQNS